MPWPRPPDAKCQCGEKSIAKQEVWHICGLDTPQTAPPTNPAPPLWLNHLGFSNHPQHPKSNVGWDVGWVSLCFQKMFPFSSLRWNLESTLSAIRLLGFQWVTAKCLSLCLSLLFSVYKLQTLLAESIAKKATDHDVKHVVKPSRRVFIEKYKTVLHILKLSRQKAWKRSHFVN